MFQPARRIGGIRKALSISIRSMIVFDQFRSLKMGDGLRREVLRIFKQLHRTRVNTFKGDERALGVVRNKINEEYKKYKNVTNPAAIEELNKFAQEVEHEVRTTVIQAVQVKPGKFALNIRPEIELADSVPYKDLVETCNNKSKPPSQTCTASKDSKK